MPSVALENWRKSAADQLDEIEAALVAVGGVGPGRRYATLQINHAYAVMISSQFQAFCRDLHSEAADFLAANVQPAAVSSVLRLVLTQGRKLDSGNPNPGNLGADFGRLGMQFWPDVKQIDKKGKARQDSLEELNEWRNAIAHQDWSKRGPALRLQVVRGFRRNCNGLAKSFDRAVGNHVGLVVGRKPW